MNSRTTYRLAWQSVIVLAFLCFFVRPIRAQEATLNLEVIARYEQILERSPGEGPSFDKLVQIYEEGEGLEKLDARWLPWSAQPGVKGATYSLLRGLLADRMGRTDEARQLLTVAAQGRADDFHGWVALGDFEVRQGRWVDAIAALQKGLATPVAGDDRLSLERKLGQAQERNLDLPAALATWQKMVAEFPQDQFALEEAGGAELDAEQFDEARKTFQKLVDLTEPNSMGRVQALMKLAGVDDRQGRTEAAVHGYESILPLTAESSWLNRELRAQIEQVYRREDDLAGLVGYYQRWTKANPKDVDALLLLAGALNELGKKDDALDVLRQVTVLAPDRHEVRETFAEGLVETKHYDEAITVLTALTADDPTEPRYWATMGDALFEKTQPLTPESKKAVLEAWSNIAPADSKDINAVIEVADLCRDHQLNDEALAGYNRALGIAPDASDVREKAVKLLVDLKREDEAWKLLDAMAQGTMATAANEIKLATLDQRFERGDAAAAAIQKGLALEPGNFDLLSMEWNRLAEAQKWPEAIALFDRLMAAAPNPYFVEQIEIRQVQALSSAGQLEAAEDKLRARLGATPALAENELRLLLRMMIQQNDADVPKALDEAGKRFPKSVSLIRIGIDYNRHQGNNDAAVAALQKLMEIAPEQKIDLLGEMAHVQQDEGKIDDALKTAQQIIDFSPARTDGYLLYAEIALAAEKNDDAVKELQAAIKLSDKPNDVRQRLARYYLDSSQLAKARLVYDDAFEATDTPEGKLEIVRAMVPAYLQDGQIDALIARFKKEQEAEEGGWRYGLYLSAIYEQMGDFGAARRELARSLIARPQDAGLISALIALADKEGDRGEVLRYREMLVGADPSPANKIALASEYAIQDRPEDAWQIVQRSADAVAKDPLPWRNLANLVSDPDYATKIRGVLEDAIRAKGDPFAGRLALAQFQMEANDLEGAKKTLWQILEEPLPSLPPPPTNLLSGFQLNVINGYVPGFFQIPFMDQFTSMSNDALAEAKQYLAPPMSRSQPQPNGGPVIVTTTLDPPTTQNHALVYLAAIAVQQNKADDFLKELETRGEAMHWSTLEKLVAYELVQAREPLLQTMEEQARSGKPDQDLDELCYLLAESMSNNKDANDAVTRKRAQAVMTLLTPRLDKDAEFTKYVRIGTINRLSTDWTPGGVTEKQAALKEYLKTLDRKDPDAMSDGIFFSAMAGNLEEEKRAADDFAATDRSQWNSSTLQEVDCMWVMIINQAAAAKQPAKQVMPVLLDVMRLDYQPTLPSPLANSTGISVNSFPTPNRYYPDVSINLEMLHDALTSHGMMPAMYTALDQEEKRLTDWHKIYPTLLQIYFQWWDEKQDAAIVAARKLLADYPSDDFRHLLASMLTAQKKYDEVIPLLKAITVNTGPDYYETQKDLLHTERLANKNDEAQKIGLQILSLRPKQEDLAQILDDMRAVGLKDKADAYETAQQKKAPSSTPTVHRPLNQMLSEAMQNSDETRAIDLARQILQHDPSMPSPNSNDQATRTQALQALKQYGQLEDYAEEIEKQLDSAPDSIRLNWAAAEAFQQLDGYERKTFSLAPLPQWLKLVRTGRTIEGFYSLDGTNWISAGTTTDEKTTDPAPSLPQKIDIGFWISSKASNPPQATFDQVALTGKTGAAPATGQPADASGWSQADIGPVTQAGAAQFDSGAVKITGPQASVTSTSDGIHYVYQTLDGDGSIVTRLPVFAPNAKFDTGLMIRESTDLGANGVTVALNGTDGILWKERNSSPQPTEESDGWTLKNACEFRLPIRLKLARQGNTFTGSFSLDRKTWHDVFTHLMEMGPEARAGVIAWNEQTASHTASVDEVQVSPASTTALPSNNTLPGTTGDAPLPEPWKYIDIGTTSAHGSAKANDSVFTMTPPLATPDDGGDKMLPQFDEGPYGFVFQPLQGDGAISAQITDPGNGGTADDSPFVQGAGLCFRSRLDDTSPEIEFFCNNSGQLGAFMRLDAVGLSTRYWKKVASLSPNNATALGSISDQLRANHDLGSAVDIEEAVLKADFISGLTNLRADAWQDFDNAGRLGEFMQIVHDWTPPASNSIAPSNNGSNQDPYGMLTRIANEMSQVNHPAEAEQVYLKALMVPTTQDKLETVKELVQTLLDANQSDEAIKVISTWLSEKDTEASPILSFNPEATNQTSWLQNLNWSQNGEPSSPNIAFLEVIDQLGLSSRMEQALKNRADKMGAEAIDADRVTRLLLQIMDRYEACLPDVEQLLKVDPTQKLNSSAYINAAYLTILARELARWQQERPLARRMIQLVWDNVDSTSNQPDQGSVGEMMIHLALTSRDISEARDILRGLIPQAQKAPAPNPTAPLDFLLDLTHALTREGMNREATDLLTHIKTDPRTTTDGTYKAKVAGAEAEIVTGQKESKPFSLVYGILPETSPGKNDAQIYWEFSSVRDKGVIPTSGDASSSNPDYDPEYPVGRTPRLINPRYGAFGYGQWREDQSVQPSTYKIEIRAGADENHLLPVATLDNAATRGTAPIKLPSGARIVKALLFPKEPPAGKDPRPVGPGYTLFLGDSENLLKNPDCQTTHDASGKAEVAGWKGFGQTPVYQNSGGPLPSGTYQSVAMEGETLHFFSDNIPILPKTDYLFSGWVRFAYSGDIAVYCLDANGKPIDGTPIMVEDSDGDWKEIQAKVGKEGGNFPPETAFIRIGLTLSNQDFDFAGFSVRAVPESQPQPAPASPAPLNSAQK